MQVITWRFQKTEHLVLLQVILVQTKALGLSNNLYLNLIQIFRRQNPKFFPETLRKIGRAVESGYECNF